MKKKFSKLLTILLLIASIQIDTKDAHLCYASNTADTQTETDANTSTESDEKTSQAETKNQVKSDSDITDGNTDVKWPKGPSPKSLSSSSAILMDADTGLILYNKNMTDKHYPASITKIMTTLLAIENCSLNETVTFTDDEVLNLEYGASNIGTKVGETLTIDQCLYGIMLSSANEVCNGVADYVAGDTKTFGKMMTQRAKDLGAVCTNFTNPNGLHMDSHYTCAYDMALIGQEAIKNQTFRTVAGTRIAYLDKTNKSDKRILANHHNMINAYSTSRYLYPNCIGGKTGYTSVAQSTLVTFAELNDITLICVVMQGASSKSSYANNIYTDTISLLNFGFENYEMHNLAATETTANEVESPFFSTYGSILDTDTSPLQTSSSGKVLLPSGVKLSKAKQTVQFYDNITSKAGNEIGSVTYTYGNKTVGKNKIYFNTNSLQDTLLSSDDIDFTKSRYIAGRSRAMTLLLQRIFFVISGVLVVGFIIFYVQVVHKRRKLASRRKSSRRNR
ncbi:MAG: D-alanyl-D-alanine carboxypeptidase [Lachnospiraceae bacterium]|nr:D-alanyl-D-alanine carboxypeptidase [Lachnospiraceae bacterium]